MKALIPVLIATVLNMLVAQAQAIRVVTEATAYSFLTTRSVCIPGPDPTTWLARNRAFLSI